jgi:unsaturated chondroitin disaccharide hydrolase
VIQFELETDRALFEDAMEFAQQQVRELVDRNPDFYPMYTVSGKWKHEGPAWTHWCDGFLPGLMWIFHRYLGPGAPDADRWMDLAIRYTEPLEPRNKDRDIHDLGFLFFSTFYRWYQITQQDHLYLSSFVAENSLFIDSMMNVGLIFYAARETGDRMLREIAVRHSLTTRRYLVRGDGSTAHEGLFNTETGEFLKQSTQQGYRADSCWSRGLVWALYGFSVCYEYSRDPRFLETAQSCADYYITHCHSDGIPPWDFSAPYESRKLFDTSAAAIAASGLLRLCRMLPDPMKGHLYWTSGVRILRTLCSKYLAQNTNGWEGILKGGVYHYHKKLGINESVMWGEYFFLEGLESALRRMKD